MGRAVKIVSGKAQTCQCAFDVGLIVFGTHHHVAFMFLGELLYQLHVFLAVIVGTFRQLVVHLVQFLLQHGVACESLAGFLAHGGVVLQHHHLRQITYGRFIRNGHISGCGLLYAAQYFQHGGFPRSVLADKGYSVTSVDDEIHITE